MLTGWLDWQRATVVAKVEGLHDDVARRVLIPTSPRLSIASVLAHLTRVEHDWFVHAFAGGAPAVGEDWAVPEVALVELVEAYRQQCDVSRQIVASHDLDELERFAPPGLPLVSLRWILGHLIEETARHLGHLDLLRELADGARGY